MKNSFTVKGRELVIKEVQSSDPDIIKCDVFEGDISITKNVGFTAPREFLGQAVDASAWIDLIKQEVSHRVFPD